MKINLLVLQRPVYWCSAIDCHQNKQPEYLYIIKKVSCSSTDEQLTQHLLTCGIYSVTVIDTPVKNLVRASEVVTRTLV